MKKETKKRHFKRCETGYHNAAVKVLARWLKGKREVPFYVEDSIVFVPDVTCYENGIITCIYEVVYSHPLIGRKLAMIEYWCYRNATELAVYEISADYILKQTRKPKHLQLMETYIINPLENELVMENKYRIAI